MAIFRCKMCGGDLEVVEGTSYCTCEFCGRQQTIPTVKDEGLQTLFNRANVLRMKSEFDKAADVYEKILQRSDTEAEAYWGLILCKYGIEYVEDPVSFKRVPTCHRASYDAVTADEDYQNALKYADASQKGIYEAEAAAIDEIQRGIIALAQKEDPYDVFICYKETDSDGKRTQDSVIANDVYHQLTMEGFKVFYAAITLEDKLGTEYEPYIFSALNTAKVMLVLGTKPEYLSAVWVKNEWSRFLKIMQKDRTKLLIPCYRDMDPYELPEEFAHLQAQDMSKIGFINDIVRGIKKVLDGSSVKPSTKEAVAAQNGASTTVGAQIKRGNMALEDGEWDKANSFFEEALNLDPECGTAYLGQFLAAQKCKSVDEYVQKRINATAEAQAQTLNACPEDTGRINACIVRNKVEGYLTDDTIWKLFNYQCTYHSQEATRKEQLDDETQRLNSQKLLNRASQFGVQSEVDALKDKILSVMRERVRDSQNNAAQNKEKAIAVYQRHLEEVEKKAVQLHEEAIAKEEADRARTYAVANEFKREAKSVFQMTVAAKQFEDLCDYRDSKALAEECKLLAEKIERDERRKFLSRKKRKKAITIIILAIILACVAFYVVNKLVIIPDKKYNSAAELMDAGEYNRAIVVFGALDEYKDSSSKVTECEELLIQEAHVGDVITFGTYEQDNNTSNGNESITWIVLKKENNRILVISQYALIYQKYNASCEDVTWENCTLRNWLNTEFLDDAFSADEQIMIPEITVSADQNPSYSTDSGNDTNDKIFLLSLNETEEYLFSDELRKCVPTEVAVAQGAHVNTHYTVEGEFTSWWWLRSPGAKQDYAAYLYDDGSVRSNGHCVIAEGCVRPAMWISLGE